MTHLDLRGAPVSFALLQISNAFQRLRIGQELELYWCNPLIERDLFKVLSAYKWEVVSRRVVGAPEAGVRLRLKKGGRKPRPKTIF